MVGEKNYCKLTNPIPLTRWSSVACQRGTAPGAVRWYRLGVMAKPGSHAGVCVRSGTVQRDVSDAVCKSPAESECLSHPTQNHL